MRVNWLQHADFEDLGCIAPWLAAQDAQVTCTRLYNNELLPRVSAFDWLIVMGGPMNVDEHDRYPWLPAEKALILDAVHAGKKILGICLGAQLIARALGAPVRHNAHSEIGWFPVTMQKTAQHSKLFAGFPKSFVPFHWHGDTFEIPPDAQPIATSEACENQAYERDGRIVAIQFHLEVTAADARSWFEHAQPVPSRYVQSSQEILSDVSRFADNNRLMLKLLDNLAAA